MFPDFLVIGGMKCGSTSLDHYLKAHPQLFLPAKEIDFFSRHFDRGLSWYESLFSECASTGKVLGETSVSYTKYPLLKGVPERINATLARETKFIYVVRDPIDRILSHYMHSIYSDGENRPLERVFNEDGFDNLYVQFSLYYKQLELYLRFFNIEQFLIISSDDLRDTKCRLATLKSIFRFLGVDEEVDSSQFFEVKYQTSKKGKKTSLARLISLMPFYDFCKNNSPRVIRDLYIKLLTKTLPPPSISKKFQDRLIERIQPDTDALRKITQMTFPSWKV